MDLKDLSFWQLIGLVYEIFGELWRRHWLWYCAVFLIAGVPGLIERISRQKNGGAK